MVQVIRTGTAVGGHPVLQNSHGFAVGDPIMVNGAGLWAKAQANAAANLKVMTVAAVADVNNFLAISEGVIARPAHGLTIAAQYFVSATVAGAYTTTPPATAGQFVQAHLVPLSANALLVQSTLAREI